MRQTLACTVVACAMAVVVELPNRSYEGDATTSTSAAAKATESEFRAFMSTHGKAYSDEKEFAFRFELYAQAKARVQTYNASPTAQYTKGLNQFSDLTQAEYKQFFGVNKRMFHKEQLAKANRQTYAADVSSVREVDFPVSWDWSKKGATTPVRNQRNCGSCWSFAGTESIEGALFINSGKLAKLSPQAFLDCVPNPDKCGGTGGCEGATYDLLFKYATNNTHAGAVLDADYTYTGKDGTCNIDKMQSFAKVGGWVDVIPNNYTALKAAVMQQPVAVGVAAMNWGDYMGGVYPPTLCDADIDHAVLLVGWGTDPGLGDYWKIKNSWGGGWGEDGYIRLGQNKDFCGVDSTPADGFGCKDGPAKVKACGACAILTGPAYPTGVTLA